MKIVMTALACLFLGWAVAGAVQAAPSAAATARNAWSRATPPGATTGVVYLTLANPGPDTDLLISGTTPIAADVQFHSSMDDGGIMKMRPLDAIDLPAGANVVLRPSATHLMLLKLQHPLVQGQSFPLTLTFEKAGAVTVEVRVGTVGQMTDPEAVKASQ